MTEEEKRALRDPTAHRYARQTFANLNNEKCECGHMRQSHDDTLVWGHGDCLAPDCTCMKFTWKENT